MKVQLVSKTTGIGKYEGLTSEEIIAAIARHGEIKNDNGRLVKYLISHKHWSPLDMINFTFEVETSRAIARQWLRHKSLNPQEHSQRYSDKVEFENIELRLEHPTNRQSSTEVFDPEWKEIQLGGRYDGETWNIKASEAIKEHLLEVEILYHNLIQSALLYCFQTSTIFLH
jgi:thymidylate synthase (FAD)